jgi:predicted permease
MSAARIYRLLLRAYPRRFRDRFGSGMEESFGCDHDAARQLGRPALLRFWVLTATQAVWFGFAERRTRSLGSRLRSAATVDWRDAWRALAGAPGMSIAAITSLALGIGANLALFTIANSLLLKPLPVREPDRLVLLGEVSWTNPIWEQIRDRQDRLFDGAFAWSNETFDLATGGVKEPVEGAFASGRMFDVLGVPALIGRPLNERDDVRGGGPDGAVAVISHTLWRQRYQGAADVLGKRLTLDRVPFTIVGVLPAGFFGAEVGRRWDVVVPLGTETLVRGADSSLDGRSVWWLNVILRMKRDQTLDAATTALRTVQPAIRDATRPEHSPSGSSYLGDPFTLTPAAGGRSTLRGRYTRPLAIIMAVVSAVLLIACANIANLMLARASARRRDLSVRLALGASRARLARQLLAETFILAAAGTLGGFLVSQWCSAALVRQLATPGHTPYLDLSIDWRVIVGIVGITVVTAVLFGLTPAMGVSTLAPSDALKDQSRSVSGGSGTRVRDALVVAQVALSLVVIVCAGLFVRTFASLALTPLGFDPSHLLVVTVDLRQTEAEQASRAQLFDAVGAAVAATPGVMSMGASAITPISGAGWNTRISYAGHEIPASAGRAAVSWVNAVSLDWFATYGMTIRSGRDFTSGDRASGAPVTIINESFARQFFKDRNPVGDEIAAEYVTAPGMQRLQVIGVVSDAIYRSARAGMVPTMYVPMAERGGTPSSMGFTIKTAMPLGLIIRELGESLSRVAPGAGLTFLPMRDLVGGSVAQERLLAAVSGSFAALALILAALGLHGVTSYSVSRRRAEIGIRMALGADRTNVVRLVMQRLMMLLAIGLGSGALLAAWASRFVGTLLFGLEARDVKTFVVGAIVLVMVGWLAGWIPARRASRADPMFALRNP